MTKKKQPTQLSPINYIKTKARTLPIYGCYINSFWIEHSVAIIVIARQHKNGNFTIGNYMVDTFKRGLYFSTCQFNQPEEYLNELVNHVVPPTSEIDMVVKIDYSLAHNIIYRGIAFANKNGFKPFKEFEITKYILEEDNTNIEHIEIEFGKNESNRNDVLEMHRNNKS